jgi:hypothetical protein
MIDFPETVLQCVHTLRQLYADSRNCVVISYPIVEIIKYNQDNQTSLKLFYNFKDETFEIQAPSYSYYSKISHYDFNRTERRWVRDKGYLFTIIRNLKFCGIWDMVSNKDFLVVNSFNKNTNSKELLKALKEIEAL